MATYINTLKHLFESYKLWVAQNPQVITDVETTAKWVSYFIAGRISKSSIGTELIYTLSNLLILFNDKIIEKAHEANSVVEKSGYRLKVILTTLEYCEVLLETSARRIYGEKVRWTVIITIQTIKALGRYLLLFKYSESIIRSPPIKQLNRKTIQQQKQSDFGLNDVQNGVVKLERSGRVIRKVEGAPPLHFRNWQSLQSDETAKQKTVVLYQAEALYIAKPFLHLLSTGLFGTKSWKSYSMALALDIMSIRLYYKKQHLLTKEQRLELSRRSCSVLMFLLRSPFYEAVSKRKIDCLIDLFANRIPFAKAICEPLKDYIPQWQDTYFYMWST
ncbi:peroxisomal membrane protein PEX16 [Episyrphus balteatus]|uniref:peroxisomal membrane protein PEX16 n=1 Tax=Episyrphus balteatus TaxID=286459 RepID=UPI002485B7D9|nr:peroxisomal membrane protein PEX16 [Episyrphus balteatus]